MDYSVLVRNALEYYDSNNEKYDKIKKKVRYVVRDKTHQENNKKEKNVVICSFLDKNKQHIFSSKIELLGVYYVIPKVWAWAWGIPTVDKMLCTTIKNVLIYGTDIEVLSHDPNSIYNMDNVLLKNELTTTRFRASEGIQIDIHCAIASYLTKKPFIMPIRTISIIDSIIMSLEHDVSDKTAPLNEYWFIFDVPDHLL